MLVPWRIILASAIIATDISAKPLIVSRNDDLAKSAPALAWESTGCWIKAGTCYVTGYSTPIDSLGDVKGKEAETKFAEDDARQRLVFFVAHDQDPGFDEEAYSVVADIKGMQPAAVFRIEGKEGLFYLGVIKRDSLVVTSSFDEKKAKQNARAAFDAKDFDTAARLYDLLIKHDVQDQETTDYRVASGACVTTASRARASWPSNQSDCLHTNGIREEAKGQRSFPDGGIGQAEAVRDR